MKFIADLHVHSKYSRATAKNLDLENLYIAGQLKGIQVIGTGDFTHPAWFSEIKEKLIPAEEGLFKLRDDIARQCDDHIPFTCRGNIRFLLVTEISNIYKKNGKTRKNHNLVFFPKLEHVASFNRTLDNIGNIKSDGRPILGLDAKHLLELTLETSTDGFLIPAHIWTPWFSMLGSKSGFDSLEECFEELSTHIFAVETGLSSDPEMNWRVKNLDGLILISNSDAHSPMKLGREANCFDTDLSFNSIRNAIKTGDPEQFLGTIEFFPEEGKYHIDGHRKCNHRSWPSDTIRQDNLCPVCKKPMTLGVLYRVEQLADRPTGQRPLKTHPSRHTIPLVNILSELLSVGPNSKRVQQAYHNLLNHKGPELSILHDLPLNALNTSDIPLLDQAILRMRQKNIQINPGYDGEFGRICIFTDQERDSVGGQKKLFKSTPVTNKKSPKIESLKPARPFNRITREVYDTSPLMKPENGTASLNIEQEKVIQFGHGPLIVAAGPGTGKTYTIIRRIARLIEEKIVLPAQILGITFTNHAAREMVNRLKKMLPHITTLPLMTTFHAFCLNIIKDIDDKNPIHIIDDDERRYLIKDAIRICEASGKRMPFDLAWVEAEIIKRKQIIESKRSDQDKLTFKEWVSFKAIFDTYQQLLRTQHLLDYEDLIRDVVLYFERNTTIRDKYRRKYPIIFVDEYQDINTGQYRLIRTLADEKKDLCVIGDPDQSIYGFRGSDVAYFNRFLKDYPQATSIRLVQNFRSTQNILSVCGQLIQSAKGREPQQAVFSDVTGDNKVGIIPCANEKHESVTIGKMIESMVGGIGFYSMDFGKVDEVLKQRAFSDFAILYRTSRQADILTEYLISAGIPFQIAAKNTLQLGVVQQSVISILKVVLNKGSFADVERILPDIITGIGAKSFETLKTWAYKNAYDLNKAFDMLLKFPIKGLAKERQLKLARLIKKINKIREISLNKTLSQLIDVILEYTLIKNKAIKYPDFEEQIQQLKKTVESYGNNSEAFFENKVLQTDTDVYETRAEKVTLMTMHAAKGLEFPVVFICGCEDGLIPLKRVAGSQKALEEERRLIYVAMTRAEEELYLTHAKKRIIYGKSQNQSRSPFIMEIEDLLQKINRDERAKKRPSSQTQLKLFS